MEAPEKFEVIDIARKLLGPINPVGESNSDTKRLLNLDQTKRVVEHLLKDIIIVAENKDNYQHSVSELGKSAYQFLEDISETLKDNLERLKHQK